MSQRRCPTCQAGVSSVARFCQEGHPLTRKCIRCTAEFPVDHVRCDDCGWPQDVNPNTDKGRAMALERAIIDLGDPTWEVVDNALDILIAEGSAASRSAAAAAVGALMTLLTHPSFESRSLGTSSSGSNLTEHQCWEALAVFGHAAMPAVPLLRERMEEIWPDRHWRSVLEFRALLESLAAISPSDALIYCKRGLDEEGKATTSDKVNIILETAFSLGEISIPILKSFCGLFSGYRGRACESVISSIRRGDARLSLPSY